MKNILAENMLRFGVKNLSESDMKPYILEQVTSNPIYSIIYSKLGDKSKRYWDGISTEKNIPKMTDTDKEGILTQIEQKINTSVEAKNNQGRNTNFNKELKNITAVQLRYKEAPPAAISTSTEIIEIPYSAQYPDASTNNPELQNFYLTDNEIEVLPDRRQKFEQMIQELKSMIPASETIKEIHIKAGSSTSKVPTTYKGGKYKTIQEGQQNNIALANDRCMKIEQVLIEIIKIQFPKNDDKIIIDNRQSTPNNGPEYTSKERSYFFGTGKLDPAKKSEYDALYGPYKGSYGSVMIITTGVSTQSTSTENIIKSGEWYVRLERDVTKSAKPKKKFRSKTGGGISVGGGAVIPSCPIWD